MRWFSKRKIFTVEKKYKITNIIIVKNNNSFNISGILKLNKEHLL